MLESFYGVEAEFPLRSQLIARNLEAALPKRLYFVSREVLELMLADVKEQLKIVSTGLKVGGRQGGRKQKAPAAAGLSCGKTPTSKVVSDRHAVVPRQPLRACPLPALPPAPLVLCCAF